MVNHAADLALSPALRYRRFRSLIILEIISVLMLSQIITAMASAAPRRADSFQQAWARTDEPVAKGAVNRTWMWGPEPLIDPLLERYAQSPGGWREVQYFDKTRMEINNPLADESDGWYVTNGLLAKELITGSLQIGDTTFEQHAPANVNIAGDLDSAAPTYAAFRPLMSARPLREGEPIVGFIDSTGRVNDDAGLASFGVVAARYVQLTNHTVASVFWDFMNSTGLVSRGSQLVDDRLFDNPYYATGYPITEAYWATVAVGGVRRTVLTQVFERRVLTYTPENPDGWKVEAGNVGLHYFLWRYRDVGELFCSPVGATSYVDPYWADPQVAVRQALRELGYGVSSDDFFYRELSDHAYAIRNMYSLVTGATGCMNDQTVWFFDWLKYYIELQLTPLSVSEPILSAWSLHVCEQVSSALYYPNSPIAAHFSSISSGLDPMRDKSGPWAYWDYLIDPHSYLTDTDLARRSIEASFMRIASEYEDTYSHSSPSVRPAFRLYLLDEGFDRYYPKSCANP